MPVILQYLVLTNFKSFKGETIFGPIKDMSVIVGENGSGKSNIIDAIGFVLGASAKNLRLKRLTNLIHGANSGNPEETSAQVSAVFALDEESNRIFTRSISKTCSQYKVHGQLVTPQEYRDQLKDFGIILNGRNCLISQGMVESIAMESPKDLCVFLEELSGSIEYKAEYNRLHEEVSDIKRKMHDLIAEKKSLLASKRAGLKVKEQTETYKMLYEKSMKLKWLLQLFEIYHIEREVDALLESVREENEELERLVEGKERTCARMKEIIEQEAALTKRLEATEKNCRDLEHSFKNKEANVNSIQEEIAYCEARLKTINAALAEERVAREAHERTIKELRTELREIERLQREFDDSVTEELSTQASSVELSNSQVREYTRLQPVVQKEASTYVGLLRDIQQQQDTDQSKLDNEERKKADLKDKLHYQKISKDEAEARIRKLERHVKETEENLVRVMRFKADLCEQVKLFSEQRVNIETALNAIHNELKDAAYDNQMIVRSKQKAETVTLLRNLDDGMYGRISDLCKPVHSRYNVAVTKVFGKFMDAIVVDTLKTAKNYINQLKQQRLGVETFLPLDNLKVAPLNERLRDISGVTNVRLLYDVIQINSEHVVGKAILFLTKNTLVCDSPKDAYKIAYEFPTAKRQNCVTLDGTLYRKDGTFSGGLADLSRRAKVWEENDLEKLIAKQRSLQDEMKILSKTFHFESDLDTIATEVNGYGTRLKYSKYSLDESRKALAAAEEKIKAFSEKLHLVCSTIVSINARIKERKQSIQDLESAINSVEDKVYSTFCQEVGVQSIRQYEQRDLIRHQEREKRRLELETQFNRISNMLSYEMERGHAKSNLEKNEKLANTIGQDCEEARRKYAAAKLELEEAKHALDAAVSMCSTIKAEFAKLEKTLSGYREETRIATESIRSIETKRMVLLANIERKKLAAQYIIKNSKIAGIPIPLLRGSIVETLAKTTASSSALQQISPEADLSQLVRIDNSQLLEHLDNDDEAAAGMTPPTPRRQSGGPVSNVFRTHLQVDYSKLPEDLKSTDSSVGRQRLNGEIGEIEKKLQEIQNPDMKVEKKLEVIVKTLNETGQKIKDVSSMFNAVNDDFHDIKAKRLNAFNECFDYISSQLTEIYRELYKDPAATALIVPEDVSEPYLGGLHFSCMVAGRRVQPMDSLSGGEKTFASLAMIFALNNYRRTPFFALDEVDAALDNQAISNLSEFILKKKTEMQFIIVSLRRMPYYADALYGITIDPDAETMESLIFSLDLLAFPQVNKKTPEKSVSKDQS